MQQQIVAIGLNKYGAIGYCMSGQYIVSVGSAYPNKFSALDDTTQNLIITIGTIAAAIGPLALIIGGLGGALVGILLVLYWRKNRNSFF